MIHGDYRDADMEEKMLVEKQGRQFSPPRTPRNVYFLERQIPQIIILTRA
jgi:hypothetical protein